MSGRQATVVATLSLILAACSAGMEPTPSPPVIPTASQGPSSLATVIPAPTAVVPSATPVATPAPTLVPTPTPTLTCSVQAVRSEVRMGVLQHLRHTWRCVRSPA